MALPLLSQLDTCPQFAVNWYHLVAGVHTILNAISLFTIICIFYVHAD